VASYGPEAVHDAPATPSPSPGRTKSGLGCPGLTQKPPAAALAARRRPGCAADRTGAGPPGFGPGVPNAARVRQAPQAGSSGRLTVRCFTLRRRMKGPSKPAC
jgi:hypothetical protein